MGVNVSCCEEGGNTSTSIQGHFRQRTPQPSRHAATSTTTDAPPHHLIGFSLLNTTTPCDVSGANSTNRWEVRELGSPSASGVMMRSTMASSSARLTASDNMTTVGEASRDVPTLQADESFLVAGLQYDACEVVPEEQPRAAVVDPVQQMTRIPSGSSSVPTTSTSATKTTSSQPTAATHCETPQASRGLRGFVSVVDSMDLVDDRMDKQASRLALRFEPQPSVALDERTSQIVALLELPLSAFSPDTSFA